MRTLKADVVREWISKYSDNEGKLTIPKQELARRICHANSGMFASVEDARSAVRYYTGSTGKKRRESLEKTNILMIQKSTIEEGLLKSGIVSKHTSLKKIPLPKGKWLILCDIHIPFQHDQALAAAIHYGIAQGCTNVLLNGDILDCYDISRFSKETNRPKIKEEIEMGKSFLTYLRSLFPNGLMYYKLGNHEERMRHYILRNARELSDLPELELDSLLDFKALNIKRIDREILTAGKLAILHGHETGESVLAPVNAARGMFLKTKSCVIFGHQHQRSVHEESDIFGNSMVVHSLGALCHLDPEYKPMGYMKWSHGAGILEVQDRGKYNIENFKILNGEIFH